MSSVYGFKDGPFAKSGLSEAEWQQIENELFRNVLAVANMHKIPKTAVGFDAVKDNSK